MPDLKDRMSPELVEGLGRELAAAAAALDGAALAGTSFDGAAFERLACDGLEELELKARIDWIARALAATMPTAPEHADRLVRAALDAGGLQGWASLPVGDYVAATMLERPDIGLPLLAALTPRATAEFAIRPFLEAQYEPTMAQLRTWVDHPDEHVRRLVSEGTRPRLPWGRRLSRFIGDPSPAIPLLDALVEDDSLYVRRSVANHLNDISRDHPALALDLARRWSERTGQGDYVVRHGLRTLVKRGSPEALAILGFDHGAAVDLTAIACSPDTVAIGEATTISVTLRAATATRAAIDYVVHYQGARGPRAGKVFKLAVRDLPAGETVGLARRQRFAHASIRTIHPGPHRIEVQVNGRVLGETVVEVTPAD